MPASAQQHAKVVLQPLRFPLITLHNAAVKPNTSPLPSFKVPTIATASACPDLQCIPGLDLANLNPANLGEAGVNVTVGAGGGILSVLPISIIATLTKLMVGAAVPGDARAGCAVPVLTGKEIKAFNGGDVNNEGLDFILRYAQSRNSPISRGKVVEGIKNLFSVCKGLPFKGNSTLGRRSFVWGTFGTMQLGLAAEALGTHPRLKKWFASGAGRAMARVMKAAPSLAVCAAINPCTSDYVFSMEGLAVEVPLPIVAPPGYAKDAGVKAMGWSSKGNLAKDFTAWDPFELHVPFGDAQSFSPQTYRANGKFLVQLEAKFEVGFGAPMKFYIPSLAKTLPKLTVGITTKLSGTLVWGSDAKGWQLLLRGSSGPPALNILDVFTLPYGLVGADTTLFLNSRESSTDGTGGFFNIVFKYEAVVRLADVLKNISPFGESLVALLDSDDANPVRASSGFEVRIGPLRGTGVIDGVWLVSCLWWLVGPGSFQGCCAYGTYVYRVTGNGFEAFADRRGQGVVTRTRGGITVYTHRHPCRPRPHTHQHTCTRCTHTHTHTHTHTPNTHTTHTLGDCLPTNACTVALPSPRSTLSPRAGMALGSRCPPAPGSPTAWPSLPARSQG